MSENDGHQSSNPPFVLLGDKLTLTTLQGLVCAFTASTQRMGPTQASVPSSIPYMTKTLCPDGEPPFRYQQRVLQNTHRKFHLLIFALQTRHEAVRAS